MWIAQFHLWREPDLVEQQVDASLALLATIANAQRQHALLDDLGHTHARVE